MKNIDRTVVGAKPASVAGLESKENDVSEIFFSRVSFFAKHKCGPSRKRY